MPRATSPGVGCQGSGLSFEGWGCRFCCVVFSFVVIAGPHFFPPVRAGMMTAGHLVLPFPAHRPEVVGDDSVHGLPRLVSGRR